MLNFARKSSFLPLALFLPAACATTPVPFHIEHAGTLSTRSYTTFDQLAAAQPPRLHIHQATPTSYPEPYWVFTFDAPFDPRSAPLRIGSFTGNGTVAASVASNLPDHLRQKLSDAHLFPVVTLEALPHAFLLSGTVTRADDESEPFGGNAATQVEAIVSRDGTTLGSIQVNAIQLGYSTLSPLGSLIMSAAQGSRSTFVSRKFEEVFTEAAKGAQSGIGTSSQSSRFMVPPEPADPPPPDPPPALHPPLQRGASATPP